MRISKEQLQKIIAEEVRAHVKKKLMSESVSEPRTVKATPAMLKRIIAEEAAKINEMHDEGHPDDKIYHDPEFGGMYSDKSYEALQDEWAADAARKEAERKNEPVKEDEPIEKGEPLYLVNVAFLMLNERGRLIDLKTKEVLLDLSYGAYTTGTGAPVDKESMKKIKCVAELKGKRRLAREVSIDRYHNALIDCLKKCEIIRQGADISNFMFED